MFKKINLPRWNNASSFMGMNPTVSSSMKRMPRPLGRGFLRGLLLVIFSLFFSSILLFAEIPTDENVLSEDATVLDLDSIIQNLDEITSTLNRGGRTGSPFQWIFMVYMVGDNNLEAALIEDFEEMAQVGSTEDIAVIVQLDRHPNSNSDDGYSSDYGNWTKCARFIVDEGDTPFYDYADAQLEEVDMGDTQTLVDFVDWVLTVNDGMYAGASHYALIMSNHGDGWREEIERLRTQLKTRGDELSLGERENILRKIRDLQQKLQKREHVWKAVCFDDTNGDALNIREVKEALEYLQTQEIIDGVDLIGFDACLMGMLEIAYELKDYATVMVASEKTEDLEGWPYTDILNGITTGMTPAQLGDMIVEKYGASPSGRNDTLSAVRLQEQLSTLSIAVSTFAQTVMDEHNAGNDANWDVIFNAQQRAGYYEPYFSYRDLRGFMQNVVADAKNQAIRAKAQAVITAFRNCLIANYSSSADKGKGLSIYFPEWFWGDECWEASWGDELIDPDYNGTNLLFLEDIPGTYTQSWDDFLLEYVNTYLVPNHSGTDIHSRRVSGGTTASAYVMVSSPVFPGNPDPLAVLKDDLGSYDKKIWRLFRWNPISESYQEYPFSGDNVVPGKGYWLISRNTKTIDATGQLAETNSPYDYPYFIALYPGWNQIGTPFNFDIDWDTVWVSWWIGGDLFVDLDLIFDATSSANVYTSRTLWRYANGSYSACAVMSPGEGYWIYNYTGGYVYLIVNPVRSTLSEYYRGSLERALTEFGRLESAGTPPSPPGGIDAEPEDEESSEGSSGGSGCFIATASFGSPLAAEVNVLRDFRDEYLLKNSLGKKFVSLYYKYSPPVARIIENNKFLKAIVRTSLYPIVKSCKAFPHTN